MSLLRFEWDAKKATGNLRKHGISFEEAETVFVDEEAILIPDEEHSMDEDRFVLIGFSEHLRVLIISARKANKPERMQYDQRRTR